MLLNIFILAIFLICVSMTWTEGLWTNTLTCFNAIFAAIIATNYFEPVADVMQDNIAKSFTYFWDFLSLWGLNAFAFIFLRTCTDQFSTTRVRFRLPLDKLGAGLLGLLTGWVVVCFFLFTVHTAPLEQKAFGGKFGNEPKSDNFYLAPDRLWLGFMQSRSETIFSGAANTFDPDSVFILKYGQRRKEFTKTPKMTVKL